MRHFSKLLVLLMAAIMALTLTAVAGEDPAFLSGGDVQVFETPDGVLSIEAPSDDDKWTVIQDDKKLLAISDGTDTITVEHYANGEELPAVALAKDDFVQIYQVYFSTKNEVFIVTGEVTVAEDMPYVRKAVNSFEVLKYDTKQAKQDNPDAQPEPVYDIRKIESDMYCNTTDGVNVRASYSTDSERIGSVSYGEKVYVIGEVTKDGENTGWLKISYGNGEGYVYKTWFDDSKPEETTPSGEDETTTSGEDETTSSGEDETTPAVDPQRTGEEMTLYREDGQGTKEIYYYNDNKWRDDNGQVFYQIDDHKWDVEGHGQYFWYDDPGMVNQ